MEWPFTIVNSDAKLFTLIRGDRSWTVCIDKVNQYSEHEPMSADDNPVNVGGEEHINPTPAEDFTFAIDAIFNLSNNIIIDEDALSVDELLVTII